MHEIQRPAGGFVAWKMCENTHTMDAPGCAGEASMWCPDIINFDAVDFNECHSKEVIIFFRHLFTVYMNEPEGLTFIQWQHHDFELGGGGGEGERTSMGAMLRSKKIVFTSGLKSKTIFFFFFFGGGGVGGRQLGEGGGGPIVNKILGRGSKCPPAPPLPLLYSIIA